MADIADLLEMGGDELIDIGKLVEMDVVGFPEGNETGL